MKTFRKFFLLFIKQIEKLIRFVYNNNTGYFYYARIFYYEGIPRIGYVICKGYRYVWVDGFKVIDVATSEENLAEKTEQYKAVGIDITGKWKQGNR